MSEQILLNTARGKMPAWSGTLRTAAWLAIFLAPLLVWRATTDLGGSLNGGVPAGQNFYVLSKLFGLYAGMLLWFQAVWTLLKRSPAADLLPRWQQNVHRNLGLAIFVVTALHVACFVSAASLRQSIFAWPLLLPDFKDYFHTFVTVGLLAFYILLLSLLAALFRARLPRLWRTVHRGMLLVVPMALLHSVVIGTETRYGIYLFFYGAMAVSLLAALGVRFFGGKPVPA